MNTFDAHHLPTQAGKTAVVTGANSGIGFETAKALARAGAHVILGGRNLAKVEEARRALQSEVPSASTSTVALDLADLASVHSAASAILAEHGSLDLLVNNAGVMAVPERRLTTDGFELTFGTNHLGHFALTGLLLPALLAAPSARIVQVSAQVARRRGIDLDDPESEQSYSPMGAYAKSKLANVLFVEELARRGADPRLTPVAVHPGTSMTGLQRHGSRAMQAIAGLLLERLVGQSTEQAALPSLFAATQPGVAPGAFVAPTGRAELRGAPGFVRLPPAADDRAAAAALWAYSEARTGVRFEVA
ncbi:hypothetical protein AX769_00555 [Frondihabitans sp. PAMC 28766]|uniref:oxidoreductase n=1 Tax=Frondihabitans sp. PAMC 28766 TaxID=1795630 RepID=UPI00078C46FA|nr:oxidoreductase [Frondihabitans sp. PAMC 28766]AMM18904.1 hypothetical protein AX769_00555 [Frondihabitans sp. PAMC 28766]